MKTIKTHLILILLGESTDSNYSISSTGLPVLENLCTFKERSCSRLCIIDSPFCALHTLGHSELPYIQCAAQSDSFQCKNVVHKMQRTKYCSYHETVKLKNSLPRNYDTSEIRKGFNNEIKIPNKNDEPRTLIESLYRSKENDAYYDNFSSDGESVDSEGSEDLLKHTGQFTTEELLNQALNRWRKYLSLCTEALGELRYEMIESHKDMCSTSVDTDTQLSVTNSPRYQAELKAYKKFLKIPKQETIHANDAMMLKFMTTYKEMKPNGSCQFTIGKSGSAKDRCNEVAIPCSNYCLNHLMMKSETKAKSNFDKLPNQVLFKRCGGGPDRDCGEIVVKWNPESRCAIHTGFEDAIFDPIINDHNKQLLHNAEMSISEEFQTKPEHQASEYTNK